MDDLKESTVAVKTPEADKDESMKSDTNEESDDEFLAPAIFLYDKSSQTKIQTPKKVHTPIGNDLSPITPTEEVMQGKKKRRKAKKFCFSKLVTEKAAQDEIDRKFSKMKEELREGIKNGGIFDMIMREEGNNTDGDLSEDSQDASDLLPQHRNELDKNIRKMNEGFGNDFPDGFPGEALFSFEPNPLDLRTPIYVRELMGMKQCNTKNTPQNDTDSLTDELLMSGFLIDLSLSKKNIDASTLDWLLNCICFSSKTEIIEASFNSLWAFMKTTKVDLKWKFTADKFWSLLSRMGASEINLPASSAVKSLLSLKSDVKHGPARTADESLSLVFLHRLQTFFKCFSCYVKKYPAHFLTSDVMVMVLLGFRLSIALEVNACAWEFEVLIGCAIDLYSEEEWEVEALKICKNVLGLTNNHSNRLQLVEIVPVTTRGRELKKLLALTMMSSIMRNSDVDTDRYGMLLHISIIPKVLDLVSRIHTNQDSDFHKLFSIISFINHCTPEESISTTDKKKLESLITALRRLNGEIRDPGGYYLNRTKVKDLIIRTLNRLTHIASGLQTQSSLDGFFGEKTSSFDQLKFETLEDQPYKLEMPDDDSKQDDSNGQSPGLSSKESSSDVSSDSLTDEDSSHLNENPLADLNTSAKNKMEMNL